MGMAWVTWANFGIFDTPNNFWTKTAIRFKFGTEMEDGPCVHRQRAVFASLWALFHSLCVCHHFLCVCVCLRVCVEVSWSFTHPSVCLIASRPRTTSLLAMCVCTVLRQVVRISVVRLQRGSVSATLEPLPSVR